MSSKWLDRFLLKLWLSRVDFLFCAKCQEEFVGLNHIRTTSLCLVLAASLLVAGLAGAQEIEMTTWSAPPFWSPPQEVQQSGNSGARTAYSGSGRQALATNPVPLPYVAIVPCRQYDSRNDTLLPQNTPRTVNLLGVPCAIPPDAQAVAANITVFNISGAGSNGVFKVGIASPPTTSWINYPSTETQRANAGVLPLGAGGTIVVQVNQGAGSVDFLVDVFGYYSPLGIVNSLNGQAGDLTLVAGSNVTINSAGSALTISTSVPTGPAGPSGATGPAGPAGATGPQGPAGATGATGSQGPVGATGAIGATGSQGPIGLTGSTGAQGAAGANGTDGKSVLSGTGAPTVGTGVDGEFYIDTSANLIYGPKFAGAWPIGVSIVGPIGATGAAGATGATGSQGPAGATGATGATGAIGALGPQGVQGLKGDKGDTGATGANGATGVTGPTGPTNYVKNLPMAGCYNSTAGPVWDLPTSSAATPACVTGTSVQKGVLNFTTGQSAQISFLLPPTLSGGSGADLKLVWSSAQTSATFTWTLTAACTTGDGAATDDPAYAAFWPPAGVVTDNSSGTANGLKVTSQASVAYPSGCTAGTYMHLKLTLASGASTSANGFNSDTLQIVLRP
jgi:hypothetical protein